MKWILGRAQRTWNNYDSVNELFLCLTQNAKSSAFRGHLNERSSIANFKVAPTLDAFASAKAHKLPRYFSWEPDHQALGRDSLLYSWDPLTYLFPPVPLIPKILNKVREERIEAILICPMWPTAMWWLLVQNLLLVPPLPLPPFKEILTQVSGGKITVFLEPLVACYISGKI